MFGPGTVTGKGYLYKHNMKKAKIAVQKLVYDGKGKAPAVTATIGGITYAIPKAKKPKNRSRRSYAVPLAKMPR